MKYLKNKTKWLIIVFGNLILGIIINSSHALSPTATSGFMCEANDVGALTAGQLIRTTNGIINKSNRSISIYCPVDTNTTDNNLEISIFFITENVSNIGGLGVPANLNCWLAFNYGPSRRYITFSQKGNGANFKTYVNVETSRFKKLPVIIKCDLRPNEQLISIKSNGIAQ